MTRPGKPVIVVLVTAFIALGVVGAWSLATLAGSPAFSVGETGAPASVHVLGAPTCTVTVTSENPTNNAIQNEINNYTGTPGSTVCIGAGTFPEQLTINSTSDFTLWGDGNTSTILQPTTVGANARDGDAAGGLPTFAIIGASHDTNLLVANLAVDGSLAYGSVAGCDGYAGIYYNASSGLVTGTTVSSIDQLNGCQSQNAIYADNGFLGYHTVFAESLYIGNNTVSEYGKNGITCDDSGIACTIQQNTVSTNAKALGLSATNGIQLAWGATGHVFENAVSGNVYSPYACTGGDYFFVATSNCNGAALYSASGILAYAAGSGVNISQNVVTNNQLQVAVYGGPASVWSNTVRGGYFGLVFDFNATPGWLGSQVYASGPFDSVAGANQVTNANVGVFAYDANVTMVGDSVVGANVGFAVATDLPVSYWDNLTSDTAHANVSGALLGDVSSYQPGDTARATGNYELTSDSFVNSSTTTSNPGATPSYGALIEGASATVSETDVTGFDHGISVATPMSGSVYVTFSDVIASPTDQSTGIYVFAGVGVVDNNYVAGYSWDNGAGWWPNSQATGIFVQCYSTCDVENNGLLHDAIGIAVDSYLYGAFPSPLWPYAAPASIGPITVTGNVVSNSEAFGIALELNQNSATAVATPTVSVTDNTVDNSATGAVGAMFDQGTYYVDSNVFVGTRSSGSSGASQPTGVGTIGTASVQVLNAYDDITEVHFNDNAFENTSLGVALLNITATAGDFASYTFGDNVTFTESGLPTGTAWYVNLSASAPIVDHGTSFFVDLANGSYSYTAASGNKEYTPVAPSSSLTLSGTSASVAVPFAQVDYGLTFTESGLPAATSWSVFVTENPTLTVVQSTTGTSLTFNAPNGSFAYVIANVPGWHLSSGSYAGTAVVNGGPTTVALTFAPFTYAVNLVESGLPSGTPWSGTIGGTPTSTTTTKNTVAEPNGSVAYTVNDVPGWHLSSGSYSGTTTVSGAPTTVALTFAQVTYGVTFQESGIAAGQTWTVTFAGSPQSLTTDGGTDTLTFAAEANGTYAYSIADVAGWHQTSVPYSGTEVVNGAPVSVSVTYGVTTYGVSFSESGLPSGLTWTVTVAGVPLSLTTDGGTDTLTFAAEANGTYSYAITDVSGWHQSTLAYGGSIVVNGGAASDSVTYAEVVYPVAFLESGLPSGLTWTVTFNGVPSSLTTDGGTDTLTYAAEPNGSYAYSVTDVSGWHQTSVPYSGTEAVSGAGLSVALSYGEVEYQAIVHESGLPAGTSWSVTIGGTPTSSTSTANAVDEPNGSYAYTIADVPGWHITTGSYAGTLVVSGTAAQTSVVFSQVVYGVTFQAFGLPTGQSWSVTVNGTTITSTAHVLNFGSLPNGTYTYTVANVPGWHLTAAHPYSGTIVVNGAKLHVAEGFLQVKYLVQFTEIGLPAGTSWTVTVGVTTVTTTSAHIVFHLANGTYSFTTSSTGYTATPNHGSFTVAGAKVFRAVHFS